MHGHGIEANYSHAIQWFERSAELGEPRAFYSLGCIYEKGEGVRIDVNKAIEFFRRGGEQQGEP